MSSDEMPSKDEREARLSDAPADRPDANAAAVRPDTGRSDANAGLARLLRLRARRGPRATGGRGRDPLEVSRWALMLGVLLTFLIFLALLVVFFLPREAHGASEGVNFDRPTKEWYGGPVRYIITKQEVKAYKALETELDRRNFIDWFWQRRDTEPSTPENEFRNRYEQRVYEATRMFSETSTVGWKTDMGKVYILIGPPDEMNKDTMAKTHRGIVTWVYRKPPFPDLPSNTVIGFAKDTSGEFRLSATPTLDSDVARGLKFSRTPRTADDRRLIPGQDPALLAAGAPLSQGELETMLIFGRVQQLPPKEEEMFRAFVTSRESFGSIPLQARADFYRGPQGLTYTSITVGVKSSSVQYRSQDGKEIPDVSIFGKLIDKVTPELTYALADESSFVESPENEAVGTGDLLVYQATGAFKPGKYQLILGVQDRVSKRVSSYRQDVEIPDKSAGGLSLSSITLAGMMEPTEYRNSGGKPFAMGKFKLVPRPDNIFSKSGELNVYFQIYGPTVDPETKRPKLDILYTFKARAADGTYSEMGTYKVPGSAAQVQGYAVPLEKWPPGAYQLVVTVVDTIDAGQVSGTSEFLIR